jgi:hypothetical protein
MRDDGGSEGHWIPYPAANQGSIFYDQIGQDEDLDTLCSGSDCHHILSSGEK